MSLTAEQKTIVAEKLAAGEGIAEVQRLINDSFKLPMTYMEVRFLLDDLDLELAAPAPEPEPPEEAGESGEPSAPAEPVDANAELLGQGVTLEVDRIKRPGAAMSGTVSFSDGVSAKWYVDPYGRLGLEADQEGYQPSQEDIEAFQLELQKQMRGPTGL